MQETSKYYREIIEDLKENNKSLIKENASLKRQIDILKGQAISNTLVDLIMGNIK